MNDPEEKSLAEDQETPRIAVLVRNRSVQVTVLLWLFVSVSAALLTNRGIPLNIPALNQMNPVFAVAFSSIALVVLLAEMGVVLFLSRGRLFPKLDLRAPERAVAKKETWLLWIYVALVMLAGRYLGIHFFGEGIALHLNGSLVGATRIQSPIEVCTCAAYNGILLALIPYIVFRLRGYSHKALNLKSANFKNDFLVILGVLLISCLIDLAGPNLIQLSPHQQIVGGLLSFFLNMAGTDLPVMIVIYAILLPRYLKLTSPVTGYLLGAVSYPIMHLFESWTRYGSVSDSVVSVLFVFLTFFPPGLMKSFLTVRTGNAWVHLWAFHAVSPHVTVDTRLIVSDFHIQ
jgi:hypothetical protein